MANHLRYLETDLDFIENLGEQKQLKVSSLCFSLFLPFSVFHKTARFFCNSPMFYKCFGIILKLVFAIFIKFLLALQKLKNVFISSK